MATHLNGLTMADGKYFEKMLLKNRPLMLEDISVEENPITFQPWDFKGRSWLRYKNYVYENNHGMVGDYRGMYDGSYIDDSLEEPDWLHNEVLRGVSIESATKNPERQEKQVVLDPWEWKGQSYYRYKKYVWKNNDGELGKYVGTFNGRMLFYQPESEPAWLKRIVDA